MKKPLNSIQKVSNFIQLKMNYYLLEIHKILKFMIQAQSS